MGGLSCNSSMEGDLKFYGDNGILVDKDEEHVDRKSELHSHMSDSSTKREVSGSCINVFVEVFGPLDEIDEGYDDLNSKMEHVIPGSPESDQEYARKENGTMSDNVTVASFKSEEGAFNVSDLVWAKTRTQTWWPGMICDPFSDAAKDATKSEKKGPFLVKYFGNPYFTWRSNSDLRPFAEYFEQMSRQNDSRNFLGSVDKAIGEIGRRVKSKMTCHCFLKESHTLPAHSSEDTEKSPSPMDNVSKFDELYLSQFKPSGFCSYIKNLASGFSVPNKIELIVTKTRLSAFYCYIGHYQLPMQLLRPSSDTPQNTQDNLTLKAIDEGQNTSGSTEGFEKSGKSECEDDFMATGRKSRKNHSDGKLASSGKEPELRERKKSKYLSYPYIEGGQNGEISSTAEQNIRDDLKNLSCGSAQSTPSSKLTGKNSRNKGSRNSFKGRYIISKADNIVACSTQLLTELHSFARDLFYPARSKYYDSLKRFYCSFRTFAFIDFEMAHGILKSKKVPTGAIAKVQKKGKGKEKVKESGENQRINSGSVIDNASNEEPEKDIQQEKGSSKRVKARKKDGVLLSAGMEPSGDLLNVRDTTPVNNSCMITFQLQGSDIPKNKTSKKRKKGEASPMDLQLETRGSAIPKNKTRENQRKGEASPMHRQLETQGSDIPKSKTPEKTKEGEASSMDLKLEMQGSDIPKNKTPEKRKKGEASPIHLQLEQASDIQETRTPEKSEKGEASPTHLQFEIQSSAILESRIPEKTKKGEASPPHLLLETQGSDISKIKIPEKGKKGESSPTYLQFETQSSDIPKNKTPENKRNGEASPMHLQYETAARVPDLNGNISSIAFENLPLGISAMHQHTQNIDGTGRSFISGYAATESTSILLHNAIDSSFHNALQKILLPSNGKPERKKWKRKKETSEVALVIPDLNGTAADSLSLEKISPAEDHTSPDGDRPQKKKRISRPNEDHGAKVLLNFALEHLLPSKETLVAIFSRFGLLRESETQVLDDSSVQIFYERTTDAQFAIRRLEKNNPFGESLVSFKFHPLTLASTVEMKETTAKAASSVGKNHKKLRLPQAFSPADTVKAPSPQKGDSPNLPFIKKNVEMMKMTLEKAGDNLSPEMRAKLENEIKGFLDKISSMESGSSP